VTYEVVLPKPMQDEIGSWGLSFETEEDLYRFLEEEFRDDPFQKWPRLAAPSPTIHASFEIQDREILGITHYFTFWMTEGETDGCLYVRQCEHQSEELWDTGHGLPDSDTDSTNDPDYGI
jgi:hypothetical protein